MNYRPASSRLVMLAILASVLLTAAKVFADLPITLSGSPLQGFGQDTISTPGGSRIFYVDLPVGQDGHYVIYTYPAPFGAWQLCLDDDTSFTSCLAANSACKVPGCRYGHIGVHSRMGYDLVGGRRYYIKVTAPGTNTGYYWVYVQRDPDIAVPVSGTPASGSIAGAITGSLDTYYFTVPADQCGWWNIWTELGTLDHSQLYLRDTESGAPLASNGSCGVARCDLNHVNGGGQSHSRIDYLLQPGKRYWVDVEHAWNGTAGSYTLHLKKENALDLSGDPLAGSMPGNLPAFDSEASCWLHVPPDQGGRWTIWTELLTLPASLLTVHSDQDFVVPGDPYGSHPFVGQNDVCGVPGCTLNHTPAHSRLDLDLTGGERYELVVAVPPGPNEQPGTFTFHASRQLRVQIPVSGNPGTGSASGQIATRTQQDLYYFDVPVGQAGQWSMWMEMNTLPWGRLELAESADFVSVLQSNEECGVRGCTLNHTRDHPRLDFALEAGHRYFLRAQSWAPWSGSYVVHVRWQGADDLTVSGRVQTAGSAPVPGVVMTGLPGSPVTAADGTYTATVPYGWSGTVTPQKVGYTFALVSRTYNGLITNQSGQNYTAAAAATVRISGAVATAGGTPVADVVLQGLPGNPATDAGGLYSVLVNSGWSGVITPCKAGYSFSPISLTVTNLIADLPAQSFTATVETQTYTISGYCSYATGAVTLTGLPGNPAIQGNYNVAVPYGWSGTVTPQSAGYVFAPESRTYTNVTSNQTGQDYGIARQTIYVSGHVRDAGGTGIPGVGGMRGVTSGTGYYCLAMGFSSAAGATGQVTPVKDGYTFAPTSRSYTNQATDISNESYTGSTTTFPVSGTITTPDLVAIPGVVVTGLQGNPVTDAAGYYSTQVPYYFTGVATPQKAGYTFSPPSRSFDSHLHYDRTRDNYTGIPPSFTTFLVSGYVRLSGGAGLPDALINAPGGNVGTDQDGFYSFPAAAGWSGTITFQKTGYSFAPPSFTYTTVMSDRPNQNSTASLTGQPITISGSVKLGDGTAVAGVILWGLPGPPVTAADGSYSAVINAGWAGTVTPVKTPITFNPASRPYTAVSSSQAAQDYTAIPAVTVSGHVRTPDGTPVPGVQMGGFPSGVATDADGAYTAIVSVGWYNYVTPTKPGCIIAPDKRWYPAVTTNLADSDFTAYPGFFISGYVKKADGTAISSVKMQGLPGVPATDSTGFYGVTVGPGWQGTVTPQHFDYTFAPPSTPYTNVTADQSNQNYTGTWRTITISGYIKLADGTPLPGATIWFMASATSDQNGFYTSTMQHNVSILGTSPSKAGYTFTPATRAYSDQQSHTSEDWVASPATFTASGYVKTADGAAIAGVTMDGLPGNPVTDSNGFYSVPAVFGTTLGTVTPQKTGLTFSPASATVGLIGGDWTRNFTGSAAAGTRIISGTVRKAAGTGVGGVALDGVPGGVTTAADGTYAGLVTSGWSGTVTPQKAGCSFVPPSTTYTNLTSDSTGQNYTATVPTFTVTGTVQTASGTGLSGVTLNGLPGIITTDGNGHYSGVVDYGWSGTVTPQRTKFTFVPDSKVYTNVTANPPAQDFTAVAMITFTGITHASYTGQAVGGVTFSGLPGDPVSGSNGVAAVQVPSGWSGTVTPQMADSWFSPNSKVCTNLTSDLTQQFTWYPGAITISGTVRDMQGLPVQGVVMSGTPGNLTSAADGTYGFSVPGNTWSATVTPQKPGYTFIPASIQYRNLNRISPDQDYTAIPPSTPVSPTISGFVNTAAGSGVVGVVMNGLPGNPATASDGSYSATVDSGWSGTVTPQKTNCTFAPASKAFTNVTVAATQDFTAQYSAAPPTGHFEALVEAASPVSRKLWDLTGPYSTTVKSDPLTLDLVHDANGKLSGNATYTVALDTTVTMPIKGSVKGTRGSITMKGTLKGANAAKLVDVSLTLNLTVDTVNRQLVGRLTGSVKENGAITPIDEALTLVIPGDMDGTWTLRFDLDQAGRTVMGTALLKFSNEVEHAFLVRGKTGVGSTAVLTLTGDPADPASKAIPIRTTITPLEGGWARLESFSGRGYGQVIGW